MKDNRILQFSLGYSPLLSPSLCHVFVCFFFASCFNSCSQKREEGGLSVTHPKVSLIMNIAATYSVSSIDQTVFCLRFFGNKLIAKHWSVLLLKPNQPKMNWQLLKIQELNSTKKYHPTYPA